MAIELTSAVPTHSSETGTMLPNFVGIGPGKCGTTWLYQALNNHPQVCVSTAKETLYFSDYNAKDFSWYLKFFKVPSNTPRPFAIGEVSNTYIFDRDVAARIAKELPDAKIIYNLRDPIDRAFSHYLFLCRNGELSCSFEEAVEVRPDLLTRGKYSEHLESYHKHFDESKRLGLFYDDLRSDPVSYAESVFQFLGVDPGLYQSDASERVLGASAARSRLLSRAVVSAAVLTRKLGYPDIVSKVKHSGLSKLIFRPFAEGEKPKLSEETREQLKPYFYQDLDRLAEMTGRDVRSLWNYQK
ncbi:Sulfotransferase domain protein [Rubripirellula obstinata]|uniref:Sulfotransferase domain protein n=1 Tax=Rubripirellula obstinata TaxID=406547 RepID=A0A5B1CFQ0_9BACT|nr:sulfotransferase [Rubripirellula obstinata]KAA1259022.1 Sulfotransferase domain protein [Rubripirellula obstinata]